MMKKAKHLPFSVSDNKQGGSTGYEHHHEMFLVSAGVARRGGRRN